MQERISKQIEELPALEKAQLVALWTENFGKPPSPNLRKGLMVQTLAYRIQEREFGGLSHGAEASASGDRSFIRQGQKFSEGEGLSASERYKANPHLARRVA